MSLPLDFRIIGNGGNLIMSSSSRPNLKSIDDLPYALITTIFITACFILGTLFVYRYNWQLIVGPIAGALLGFLAGVIALRGKKLRLSATMGEFKAAMKDETSGPL